MEIKRYRLFERRPIVIFIWVYLRKTSRGSSGSIVSDYGLDDLAIEVDPR
jgi:hypothetical protein